MYYVSRIRMKLGYKYSNDPIEISSLYIDGQGWFDKAYVYDMLKRNPGCLKVKISPYPDCIPALSIRGEKYVKSMRDYTNKDNLLSLPRE